MDKKAEKHLRVITRKPNEKKNKENQQLMTPLIIPLLNKSMSFPTASVPNQQTFANDTTVHKDSEDPRHGKSERRNKEAKDGKQI